MDNDSVGCVVVARNEEHIIDYCLKSLVNQQLKPYIVFVDDGSSDKTVEIASKYSDYIVNLPKHEESWAGKPQLAEVFNSGFKILEELFVNYVMISGADALYPSYYIKELIKRMKKEKITIASGIAEGEKSAILAVRGCGRIIDALWFKSIGFQYPKNYGFESYIIFYALMKGRKVKVYTDLKFKLLRATKFSPQKAYLWGKAMRALSYWPPYAIGRCMLSGLSRGINMLSGYLSSDVKKYQDIKDFVPKFQRIYTIKRFQNLKLFKNK